MSVNLDLAKNNLKCQQILFEFNIFVSYLPTTIAFLKRIVALLKLVDKPMLPNTALYTNVEVCCILFLHQY